MVRTASSVGLCVLLVLVPLAGVARALSSLTVDPCLAGQIKIVAGGVRAHVACHAKAAAAGMPTEVACLVRAASKIGPKLDALEAKRTCAVEGSGGQRTNDAGELAVGLEAVVGQAAGSCDSAKMKLVGKHVAALARCHAKAAGQTGNVDGICLAKATAKLAAGIANAEAKGGCSHTGQAAALAAVSATFVDDEVCALDPGNPECAPPTPTPIPTPVCHNGSNEPGEPCDPSAPSSGWGACRPDATCTDCTCACPTTLVFAPDAGADASILDAGWTGLWHRTPLLGDGAFTVQLDCAAATHPCGTCAVSGPIANPDAGAGRLDGRRCSTDVSKICASDATCAARTCLGGANSGAVCGGDSACPSGTCPAAGTCAFHAGAPMPVAGGGVGACLLQRFAAPISGTADVDMGAAALATTLGVDIYSLGIGPSLVDGPCPRCSDAGGVNDGVAGGTCDAGPRAGLACDANGEVPERPDFGRTSLDCPPAATTFVATLPIDLQNATAPVVATLTTANPSCGTAGAGGTRCLCDTCNDAAAASCSSNADCPPSGGNLGICGGRRCLGGSNVGAPCSVGSQCPGAGCGRPGEATRPFSCGEDDDGFFGPGCVDADGDGVGTCVLGPSDDRCSIASGHAQRGCSSDLDCGGASSSCESRLRTCFLTGGGTFQFNPSYDGTDTLIALGMEAAPIAGVSRPTLASVSCLGPTSNLALDVVAGLPGPMRVTVEGTLEAYP